MENQELLKVIDVTREFNAGRENAVRAVNSVTLCIERGSFLALTGPSGSGKTSLLNIMGTLDSPDSGALEIKGERVDFSDSKKLNDYRVESLGFVFQTSNLIPVLTALENVMMPLRVSSYPFGEHRMMAESILEKVGLQDRMSHRPKAMSGGQQQRVAVARALVRKPMVVLADEPTANLDTKSAFQIIDLMKQLHSDEAVSFLFSTHDDRLLSRCDNVVRLVDGTLVD